MTNDRRAQYRVGLHESYVIYYDALCSILSDNWHPISGFRSFEKQKQLFAMGRTSVGPDASESNPLGRIVTRAEPGLSYHQYGLASDWDWFDNGYYFPLKMLDERWQEYDAACKQIGVKTLTWEKPHNQLPLNVQARDLFEAWQKGPAVLDSLIRGNKEYSH